MILPFCQTHSFQLNTARFWRFCFGDQQNGLGHAGGPPPATRGSPEAPPPLPASFLPPPPHPWRRRAQALGQTAIGGAATAWPSVASPPSGTEQGGPGPTESCTGRSHFLPRPGGWARMQGRPHRHGGPRPAVRPLALSLGRRRAAAAHRMRRGGGGDGPGARRGLSRDPQGIVYAAP